VNIDVQTPTIDLLDDANNDGAIDQADEPVKDSGTGRIILASDDSGGSGANADADHLAEIKINLDREATFASLPQDLTGWKLNLDAIDGNGAVEIWDSLGKSTELDSNGHVSWDLTGGLSSVPSSVFVEATNSGTYELQVALVNPAGQTVHTDQVKVTAKTGTLTAETIGGSQGGGSPHVTGDLDHGQTAYVPVDNEDQYYVEDGNNNLIANKDQGTVQNDWALLPFKVHVENPGNGAYYLNFSDSVRIYTTPNVDGENTVISDATEINNLLDNNGDATFYIEGITSGNVQIALKAQGQADALDTLNVVVFEMTGAQDVPGSSIYQYMATGDPVGSFVDGTGGTVQAGAGAGAASVLWANEANVDSVAFQASANYLWEYYVNVVQITLTNPTLTTPGTVGLVAGPQIESASTGGPAMVASTSVTMTAPTIVVNGVTKYLGINFIQLGFIQNVTIVSASATYTSFSGTQYTAVNQLQGASGLDAEPDAEDPWYDKLNVTNVGAASPLSFRDAIVGTDNSSVNSMEFRVDDAPLLGLPDQSRNLLEKPGRPLTAIWRDSVSIDFSFAMYFAAATTDETTLEQGANNVYTALTEGSWDFNGSGSFIDSGFTWKPGDNTGNTNYGMTTAVSPGTTIVTTGSPVMAGPHGWVMPE
jgi:hypothetical protein